jgi:hypothetical protein
MVIHSLGIGMSLAERQIEMSNFKGKIERMQWPKEKSEIERVNEKVSPGLRHPPFLAGFAWDRLPKEDPRVREANSIHFISRDDSEPTRNEKGGKNYGDERRNYTLEAIFDYSVSRTGENETRNGSIVGELPH